MILNISILFSNFSAGVPASVLSYMKTYVISNQVRIFFMKLVSRNYLLYNLAASVFMSDEPRNFVR